MKSFYSYVIFQNIFIVWEEFNDDIHQKIITFLEGVLGTKYNEGTINKNKKPITLSIGNIKPFYTYPPRSDLHCMYN
jgi:hypothetical protein